MFRKRHNLSVNGNVHPISSTTCAIEVMKIARWGLYVDDVPNLVGKGLEMNETPGCARRSVTTNETVC